MLHLRDYQQTILDAVRAHIKAGRKSVLIQLATGGGKTAISATMLANAAKRGYRCAFGVHRRELVKQTMATFDDVGVRYGVISAGWHPCRRHPVQVASIPTWIRRTKQVGRFNLIVWDETVHLPSKSWSNLHAQYPDAIHVGLTATPERLDGRGLGDWFDIMVEGPSVAQLIADGWLVPFRIFTAPPPSMEGIRKSMGDFATGQLIERMNASTVTGDALREYKRRAMGRRAVGFEASVERSKRAAAVFNDAGIPSAHVDGDTPTDERDKAVADFAAGHIKVLWNVELFGEGFDLPAMECVIQCRPTMSLALHLQQLGRGLRPSPGKRDLIVLDHAGNYARHGAPDAERQWTLDGRADKPGASEPTEAPGRTCAFCYAVSPPSYTRCRECGKTFPIKPRTIEEVEGDLVEIPTEGPERDRYERDREMLARLYSADALMEFDQLVAEAKRRKYRNPEGWASHVLEGRQRRRA